MPRPSHPRCITTANQKGGVGKTTTVVNLAVALAAGGLSVLALDLDPQGNASTALGLDPRQSQASVYDVLVGGVPLHEVVRSVDGVPGLSCAPSSLELAGAEIELVSEARREFRLRDALAAHATELGAADYVLIDCPPSLGLLTLNALVAAGEVLVPIQCEYYALEGLSQLLHTIGLVAERLNPDLDVSTVLLTMYDGRTRLSEQVAAEVRSSRYGPATLETVIPRSVRISEAPSYGQSVLTYDPSSRGATAYAAAARELAERAADPREAAS